MLKISARDNKRTEIKLVTLWHGVADAKSLKKHNDRYYLTPNPKSEEGYRKLWFAPAWSDENKRLALSYADFALVKVKIPFEYTKEIVTRDDGSNYEKTISYKPIEPGWERTYQVQEWYLYDGILELNSDQVEIFDINQLSKTADIIDYSKKMFDEISSWIIENANSLKRRLLLFSPRIKVVSKSFDIYMYDTSQFKKHAWMPKAMALVQSNGKHNVLNVELHSGRSNNSAADYIFDGKISTIRLFNASSSIESGTIYISLKHELIHMTQLIMADLIRIKRMFEDSGGKYHGKAGLPRKYDPEKYQQYDAGKVDEEKHALSDVEFFTRLNDEIEVLKYKFKNKPIDRNKLNKFIGDSKFFTSLKKHDSEMYKKALREIFKIFGQTINVIADNKLTMYTKRRDFSSTPEPAGKINIGKNKHRFVIQDHVATKHHLDLRLENDEGTMTSFAIPKHKLPTGDDKLLAVKTEDHPISYMEFEGRIPAGQYGAGNMNIHDFGIYEPIEWSRDKIKIKLKGKKEKDTYALIHTTGKNWLLRQYKDK